MAWTSDARRYGAVPILIHWITAAAVIGLLASGLVAANTTDAADKAQVLRVHGAAGIAVLAVTLGRILWWRLFDRHPDPVPGMAGWQRIAARAVHGLFYAAILLMAASGIGLLALSGAGAILYFGAPGSLPDFWLYPPRIGHAIGMWLIAGLVVVHVGAVLLHQFVLGDRLLARMGIGRAR
jgi:cytochrome b561